MAIEDYYGGAIIIKNLEDEPRPLNDHLEGLLRDLFVKHFSFFQRKLPYTAIRWNELLEQTPRREDLVNLVEESGGLRDQWQESVKAEEREKHEEAPADCSCILISHLRWIRTPEDYPRAAPGMPEHMLITQQQPGFIHADTEAYCVIYMPNVLFWWAEWQDELSAAEVDGANSDIYAAILEQGHLYFDGDQFDQALERIDRQLAESARRWRVTKDYILTGWLLRDSAREVRWPPVHVSGKRHPAVFKEYIEVKHEPGQSEIIKQALDEGQTVFPPDAFEWRALKSNQCKASKASDYQIRQAAKQLLPKGEPIPEAWVPQRGGIGRFCDVLTDRLKADFNVTRTSVKRSLQRQTKALREAKSEAPSGCSRGTQAVYYLLWAEPPPA